VSILLFPCLRERRFRALIEKVELRRELDFGAAVLRETGQIALRYWGQTEFEHKLDLSPVTRADRECEAAIARAIEKQFPEDGVLGEEGAQKDISNGRRWLIDPIDGTRDFIRGYTSWAMLLALEEEGRVAAGFAYFPATDELFSASLGAGAQRNGEPIHVSAIDRQDQALLCVNGFSYLKEYAFAAEPLDWMSRFWAVRSLGGCQDAVMLARGRADVWLEAHAMPWDIASLKIIAEEAGARCFDFNGQNTIYGGNLIMCTPGLVPAVRQLLS
jgi:histidinol-phosphatase